MADKTRTSSDHECEKGKNVSNKNQEQKENSLSSNIIDETVNKKVTTPTFNENLKATLEKHGIAKQNADSFLLGLLKDKDFKKLVKENLVGEESSDEDGDVTDVPMTRSKLKEVMRNSPFKPPWVPPTLANSFDNALPKFSDLPLPENEDDEDEEYRPEESICSDTQDRSFTEAMDKKTEDDTHVEEDKSRPMTVSVESFEVVEKKDGYVGNDLISTRTRSKHSLQSTSLDVLEAAFDPPDATADMYDMSVGDYDWQKWLSDLMKDTTGGNSQGTEDEDDPDIDPDFEFPQEIEEPDHEDLRDDFSVRVSKKELDGLLDEVENMHKDDWPPVTFPMLSSPILNESVSSVREECSSQAMETEVHQEVEPDLPLFRVSKEQAELLQQQLCQHVQLLVQSNILCRNKPDLEEYVKESEGLLQELAVMGQHQIDKLNIAFSSVTPWILPDALELIKMKVPLSEPSVRLLRMERVKGIVSIPTAVAEILGNSKVFMYKELLPFSAPSEKCSTQKLHFRKSEDCLLAIGMAEMSNLPNMYELISEHMLPTKTDKQLRSRVKNVVYCRNQKDNFNPIRKFQSCGLLPHRKNDIKFVHKETAKKPLDMNGILPNWLIALKPYPVPDDSSSEYSQSESGDWGIGCKHSTPQSKPNYLTTTVTEEPPKQNTHLQTSLNTQCLVTPSSMSALVVPYLPGLAQLGKANYTPTKVRNSPRKILPKPSETMDISQPANLTCSEKTASIPITVPDDNSIKVKTNQGNTAASDDCNTSVSDTFVNISSVPACVAKTHTSEAKPASSALFDEVEAEKVVDIHQRKYKSAGKSMERMTMCEPPVVLSSEEDDEDVTGLQNQAGSTEERNEPKELQVPSKAVTGKEVNKKSQASEPGEASENRTRKKQQKPVKVKLAKTTDGFSSLPVGGYLRKIHPKLSGKKYSKCSSRELKRIQSTAKSIQSLEEDSIVQLDPGRIEKEQIFAAGFHERVEKALKGHPDTYKKYLETLIKYGDGTRSPIDLFTEISNLLKNWPELVQGFVPFLMPEQARACGLASEQEVYSRARKFLRQLEIQFSSDKDTMEKILNVFHTVAGTALYSEEKMMKSILGLLKGYPYLQDEFLTFFDDVHPPKAYFDDDFEVVELNEDSLKDPTLGQFEQVTLSVDNPIPDPTPAPQKNKTRKRKKRRLSLSLVENKKSSAKVVVLSENTGKENIVPATCNEGPSFNDEHEGPVEDNPQDDEPCKVTDDKQPRSIPPDITIISEDAISSSPFKRITEECLKVDVPMRPDTPTGIRLDNTRSTAFSHSPLSTPSKPAQGSDVLAVPVTPTGKMVSHTRNPSHNACESSEGTSTVDQVQTNVSDVNIAAQEGGQKHVDEQEVIATDHPTEEILHDEAHTPSKPQKIDSIPLVILPNCGSSFPPSKVQEENQEPNHTKHSTICAPADKTVIEMDVVTPGVAWTREIDELIITSYQKQGPSNEMFSDIAGQIKCTPAEVGERMNHLFSLFASVEETDDTSQESEEDTDMLESDESNI